MKLLIKLLNKKTIHTKLPIKETFHVELLKRKDS